MERGIIFDWDTKPTDHMNFFVLLRQIQLEPLRLKADNNNYTMTHFWVLASFFFN